MQLSRCKAEATEAIYVMLNMNVNTTHNSRLCPIFQVRE